MANPTLSGNHAMYVDSLIHWLRENVVHPVGLLQIGLVGITYLLARIISIKIRQHLEKSSGKAAPHVRFALSPSHFSILLWKS